MNQNWLEYNIEDLLWKYHVLKYPISWIILSTETVCFISSLSVVALNIWSLGANSIQVKPKTFKFDNLTSWFYAMVRIVRATCHVEGKTIKNLLGMLVYHYIALLVRWRRKKCSVQRLIKILIRKITRITDITSSGAIKIPK